MAALPLKDLPLNDMKPDMDGAKLSTPRQRLLAAVDLDGVIDTGEAEPRSPPQEGTPAWRTPARLAGALKSDDDQVDEAAVAQALAKLQATLKDAAPAAKPPAVAPPPPPLDLEAAIAAHAAAAVSLDAEEADIHAAAAEVDDALASLEAWKARRETDRKALEAQLAAEHAPSQVPALAVDRGDVFDRSEEALTSARGARGRVEALLAEPKAPGTPRALPVFRAQGAGDALREAADAEMRELEANLAQLQALHGDFELSDDEGEAKG